LVAVEAQAQPAHQQISGAALRDEALQELQRHVR
jgi:hypothetical protein